MADGGLIMVCQPESGRADDGAKKVMGGRTSGADRADIRPRSPSDE